MSKKIEDYLHLYYGANCYYQIIGKADVLYSTIDCYITSNFQEWLFVKPILRPLADITEEEEEYIQHEIHGSISNHFANAIKKHEKYVVDWRISSEVVMFLLKQHFDLFGLIESNLAIDKSNNARNKNIQNETTIL